MLQNKFFGRELWGWPKGSKRSSEKQAKAILLVGTYISRNFCHVYFVNPQDPLDQTLGEHKIYAISYENLLTNITNDRMQLFSEIKDDDFDETPHFFYEQHWPYISIRCIKKQQTDRWFKLP